MGAQHFEKRLPLPVPAVDAYGWHDQPGAFERLAPPWEPLEVLMPPRLENGARAKFRMHFGPAHADWVARHEDVQPGQQFVDVQEQGPFASWRHAHVFEQADAGAFLDDRIEYRLPMGALGEAVAGKWVRSRLRRMFQYRHDVTRGDLLAHQNFGSAASLRVAVSGSSGLVGSALVPYLTTAGHHVAKMVRKGNSSAHEIQWNPQQQLLDIAALEGTDVVVHLAGESVFGDRWSATKRRRVLESRVDGTRLIAEGLARMATPPKALVCASAVGFYGDTGDQIVDESSPPGQGFLADVCQAWENAADAAKAAGIRVVHLRFGVVLSPRGGALKKQLPLFQLGAGGALGDGTQWLSFIGLDDALDVVLRAMVDDTWSGPVNVVCPEPVTQREFAATLGAVLRRPAVLPAPSFALKLALGRAQASEMLLASSRVRPARLLQLAHPFRTPDLETTLRHCLGRPRF